MTIVQEWSMPLGHWGCYNVTRYFAHFFYYFEPRSGHKTKSYEEKNFEELISQKTLKTLHAFLNWLCSTIGYTSIEGGIWCKAGNLIIIVLEFDAAHHFLHSNGLSTIFLDFFSLLIDFTDARGCFHYASRSLLIPTRF